MPKIIKDRIKNNFELIGYVLLFVFFVAFNTAMFSNIDLILDSDKSSELILSSIIAQTNEYFSRTWYHSTELRALNTQIVFAPVFLFTRNYRLVRIIGSIILQFILFGSFYYVCKRFGIKYIPYLAICIVGIYCKDNLDFILGAPHYTTYITVSFLSFGLIVGIYHKQSTIKTIVLLILAFVSSLNGVRQLSILYIPLFAASFLVYVFFAIYKKNIGELKDFKRVLIVSGLAILFAVLGNYVSSEILSRICSIQKNQVNTSLTLPSLKLLIEITYCLLSSFGYDGLFTSSYRFITLVLSLLLIGYIVFIILKNVIDFKKTDKIELVLDLYFVISIAELFLVMALSITDRISRYFLPVAIFFVLVIGLHISKGELTNKKSYMILSAFLVLVVNSFVLLNFENETTVNHDLIRFKETILKEEAYNGYSSFWNGNVLTEMSDGAIEAYVFHRDDGKYGKNMVNNLNQWLQKKDDFDHIPEGKIFLILNDDEKELIKMKPDCPSYEGDTRSLYIFDDYQSMMDSIAN